MNLKDTWVVEWSEDEQAIHVDTLERTIHMNRRAMLMRDTTDFQVVGLFESYEQAMIWSRELERFQAHQRSLEELPREKWS